VAWRPEAELEVDGHTLKPDIWYVIAGNGLHQASMLRGDETIEIADYSHLSYDEALLLMEIDNASPLGAKPDTTQIQANLERAKDLYKNDPHLNRLIDRARELHKLNGLNSVEIPEPKIDQGPALVKKYGVEVGQLWRLGDHLVACGDCTDSAVVERVMGGEKSGFCMTDPPYNVGVAYGDATNDNRKKQDFISWCSGWVRFLPRSYALTVGLKNLLWWDDILGDPQWILAWIKRNGQGQTGLGGTNKWDAILCYGVRLDHDIDILEINNDYTENIKSNGIHPTARPVSLWGAIIQRFGQGLIYEPFLGTGTAVIACENLGRQARGIEIEPNYVAVTLERWSSLTGRDPALV